MSDEMDEIWSLYADDGAQAMDAMEAALLALDTAATGDQAPHVAALFRAVHTFKGNSRVLGLGVVESRAHIAEDLIGLVRDNGVPLDAEILGLLLETGDRLRGMLERTEATRADVDPEETEDLMVRLRDKIARCTEQGGDDGAHAQTTSEPAPEPPPAPTPEPERNPEPLPEPEPPVSQAAPAQNHSPARARLADDPTYRAIFAEMVRDTLERLKKHQDAGTPEASRRVIADLNHAARQLGLDEWAEVLAGYPADPSLTDVAAIVEAINALSANDATPDTAPATAKEEQGFFDGIVDPLSTISRLGVSLAVGETPDPPRLQQAAQSVATAADSAGYVRVAAAARALTNAQDRTTYRRAELRLYEELAAVESVLPAGSVSTDLSPARLLASWSADHIFDTLDELDKVLERLRQGTDVQQGLRGLEWQVRLVHHACRHYGLDMASQLAMSLLDLFGRGQAKGQAPDAILMRIARGFVDTLELVFDALREGEPPDTARLEQLFAEATEASFVGSGVMTATAIERRLGLPKEFHRVLSPESIKTAAQALVDGRQFHILRADVNTDNDLAEALFAFIGSGAIQAITNVTVFRGRETLFDFLIATALDVVDLTEALARMDPGGRRLVLTQTLASIETHAPGPAAKDTEPADRTADPVHSSDLSAGVLEQIGEIAAGQAMVHGMLHDLSENDLVDAVDSVLNLHGQDPQQARAALRRMADQTMTRLRDLAQLETQLLGQLAELQQTTADLRARPVETVLRPMAALVETQSRRNGREARLTTAGSEMALDIALLDSLKRILRPLVLARLAQQEQAPRRLHLSINRNDDHLAVTLEDDGGDLPDMLVLHPILAEVTRAGGHLRHLKRPGGGRRFHITLPMSLVVLEGMIVGIGGTRYVLPVESIRTILQPDPARIVHVSAQGNQSWLRFGQDEIIAIKSLAPPDAADDADPAGRMQDRAWQGKVHVILGRAGRSVAIPVDDLVGQQLVLLRPLRGLMSKVRNVTGVALLAGGQVGMVLSPGALCGTAETSESLEEVA
jgi:two-component system, chemotaxis family, sensor kinase CheA